MISVLAPLARNEKGGMATLMALMLPVILGFVALGLESARGYTQKAETQGVADMAALAAAMAFVEAPPGTGADMIEAVAKQMAVANGTPADQVAVVLIKHHLSSRGAVQVTVRARVPAPLTGLISGHATYDVASTSTATFVTPKLLPCVTAPVIMTPDGPIGGTTICPGNMAILPDSSTVALAR